MPLCPVNQRMPVRREDGGVEVGAAPVVGQRARRDLRVAGSTRTIAFRPPSVIHAAPSGPR